ncbi:hypothetical protein [uncultured Desulfuromonas sp.]|uniref:hypothetical protein n=1 Tax=uncultured Desulfuromonas sp. TaxID=181013 RepID=UPI002AAB833C|nr:hypothetical protein [uncultured Desulfuromonas sp.]
MKPSREAIIGTIIILSLVIAALIWNHFTPSRGKYHAPYKYYEGDRPNYNR